MSKINLCQQFAPTTAAAAHTADSMTTIDAAVVCNPTGTADTLSVWVAQDGGAAADDNAIYKDLAVTAGSTVSLSALVNQAMVTGAKLYLKAGTSATALAVMVSGRK